MGSPFRHASWITLVALAAIAAAYYVLSFQPQRRAIAETRQQIQQKQDCIVLAAQQAELLRAATEELRQAEAHNAAWERNTPTPRELPAVHSQIQTLLTSAGTTAARFDPQPIVPYLSISRVPLQVEVPGSFAAICQFLEGLEGLSAPVWEEELRLKRSSQDGDLVSCELDLAIFASNSGNSDYVTHSD